ncbi:MAG: DUF1295 domain-containing protein [Nanoarchaeota archaeon]|nr:DUF1295 domain-containing protein [Nanoarchaeota archaeon]
MSNVMFALTVSLAIQMLFFLPAFFFRTDKLTDLSYGLTFIILSVLLFLASGYSLPRLVLLAMIIVWALRLIIYLFIRIMKMKKDNRFDSIRNDFFRFLSFWLLQGVSVWAILINSFLFFANDPRFTILSYVGILIWIFGLVFETVSDMQKFKFKTIPKNKGKWISTGLWKYSRHPNYFGEILCWVGIYIFTFSGLGWMERIYGLVSPLFITILLLFFSGIPPLEKYADKKWGEDKQYIDYKEKTHVLVPFLKKVKTH